MRLGEECPYITPCGWCSRKEAPCNSGKYRKNQCLGSLEYRRLLRLERKKGFQKK